ncbi:tetratricopeptide repeat protein [Streptomyces sp. NPDC014986]|uniref:tetratricopeptide repeat protein n=1 Tax=Streptomyces sp. NPDC014986 TaxID=3364934 RepID=UPI0036F9421C
MPDPERSILFARQQNPVLAAEAREMSMAFADFSYLRWLTGEKDPDRAWDMYFARTQPQVRRVLDGLLATVPPEERDRAVELAGSVEAFCLPSNAVESRVFENPGEATGYLIGISPLTIQLSAEIAWGVRLAHPYIPEALPPGWQAATMHAQESLVLNISRYVRALEAIGDAPAPVGMLNLAMELTGGPRERSQGREPRDFYNAAVTFALAHELAHIRDGHLLLTGRTSAKALFPEGVAPLLQISDEENEELAADASTFTTCFNYLLGTWLLSNERPKGFRLSPKRVKWEGRRHLTAWHSAVRATEACEAYYSAVALLADITFRRGDDDTAARLLTTAMRLPYIQAYVQRTREEVLAPSYGPLMWTDRDVSYRKAHDSWRLHLIENVLPQTSRHQRQDSPHWLACRRTPVQVLEAPEIVSQAVAQWEDLLTNVDRELGPDHPNTLATKANLANLRGEAENVSEAVTALERLVTDMERVLGADHLTTFATRHNLACLRGKAGDAAGAAAAFTELLADHERVLGPGHTATQATRKCLAYWRERATDPPGAANTFTGPRVDQAPVLSPDHPDTLAVYEARLADQERTLGAGHPDALTTRWFLAMLRVKKGDAAGAAAAYAELLEHDLRAMALDDVDEHVIRNNLAHWQSRVDGEDRTVG